MSTDGTRILYIFYIRENPCVSVLSVLSVSKTFLCIFMQFLCINKLKTTIQDFKTVYFIQNYTLIICIIYYTYYPSTLFGQKKYCIIYYSSLIYNTVYYFIHLLSVDFILHHLFRLIFGVKSFFQCLKYRPFYSYFRH